MRRFKGRKKSKSKSQKDHAIRRARERYGLYVTSNDYIEACRRIRGGKAKFVDRESNRVSRFRVELAGMEVPVIYDSLRGTIVTVLPETEEVA